MEKMNYKVVSDSNGTFVEKPKVQNPRIRTPKVVSQKVNFKQPNGKTISKEILIGEFSNKEPYVVDVTKNLSAKNYRELSRNPYIQKLKPYKKAMIECLDQKGLKFQGKPLSQVVNAFYRNISVPAKGVYTDSSLDLDNYYFDNFNDTTIRSLVEGVTGYVKNVSNKQENMGDEGLTKFEKFVADKFNIVRDKSKNIAREEAANEVGASLLYGAGKWILFGVIGLLLYFVVKNQK